MSSATATATAATTRPLTFQRSPALPRNCTFDSHDWEILSRYWHPVTFAAEVADKPISVTLLDEPLVVFRSNGQLVSARDICPHRGAPLSQGWVDNGNIVCPYHGLAYGNDGKCKHIPSQTDGPIPERLHLVTYATQDAYGLVWVSLGGGTEALPAFPNWDDPDFQQILPPSIDINASAGRQTEGFIDVAHFAWIHHDSFADRQNPVVPQYSVERRERGMHAEYVSTVSNFSKSMQHRAPEGYLWHRFFDVDVPFFARLTVHFPDNGSFYSKPMLSNALAMKKEPQALASFDAMAMAAQLGAWIRVNQRVERILPAEHTLVVDNALLGYSKLVLATGADPRRLKVAGDGAADVMSINDLGDYARFRLALTRCRSVAILGAGLIGCEFANDLAAAGYAVNLIDPASTPLARLLPQDVGEIFARALDDGGIRFHPGRSVDRIDRLSDGYRLTFADGEPIVADLVVSAVGLVPRTALAAAAGLEIDQGIRTDAWCRTSAPDIYALGDCAAIDGKVQPYVLPIMHAARALARTLVGKPTRVAFPVMPITVKTPASPAVVVTPEGEGAWSIETAGDAAKHAARAVCRHATSERPLGFALLGAAIEGKAALIKTMTEGPLATS
ncbi:FAD-dependent oxidoreductase [Paraburkholderia aspalathi]|uniref:FAD-dependent oxidoreductase n=1 Tax=Paraburkholderia nemoris TaxID=2793076 RepID=UPI00190CD532|nr:MULTISPECIES: FAD-dependent oxidoreductase [Paraburkholderia]MBK3781200.1 FAD-dependent oxidoreductase [Paraburkholderia aspalathi]